MGRRWSKAVVQVHHLEYQDKRDTGGDDNKIGETVRLYKGEHWAITQMQRRKRISKGFIRALEYWISTVKDTAIDV